jgi:homoserine kinase
MKIVRTYATSANLGPGFDAFGICLNLYNEYAFEVSNKYEINEFNEKYKNPENNLIIKSYEKVFNILNKKVIPIKLTELEHNIPTSRGLGSSASCIVSGVMIANDVLGDILSIDDVFQIASDIEGHPDNVAPLIFGGLTCSFKNDKYYTVKCSPCNDFIYTVCIPSFELKTSVARSVLPENVKMADAVSNISHSVALIKALELGNMELLKQANIDKLHQDYRFPLINDSAYFIDYAKYNPATCMISGAGPTILLISKESLNISYKDWKIIEQKVNNKGAYIYER